MKKILILGAGEYQVPLIQRANSRGLYTIVVSPEGDYPGFKIADKAYYFDVRDKIKILETAKKEAISGIVTDQTDIPVKTVAYVAEKLHLPGIGYEVAKLFTDKYLMRKKCKDIGIPTIKYRLAKTISDAKKFCQAAGYPVVIKPKDNQGSRGVYKISGNNELENYFRISQGFSSDNKVLLEEFIDGCEFVVDSLVAGYLYQNLIIGDSYIFNLKNKFIPNQRFFPTIHKQEIKDRLLELDEKIIRGFGLKQGITFGEYILDSKTNNIYLLEIGARGQGVYVSSDLIPFFTGLDINKFLLDTALGEKVNFSIRQKNNISAGYIAFYLPAGKVAEINGIEEISKIDGVLIHNLNSIKKNQLTKSFDDKTFRKALLIKSTGRNGLNSLIAKIKSTIDIKVETKKGLEGIIWD